MARQFQTQVFRGRPLDLADQSDRPDRLVPVSQGLPEDLAVPSNPRHPEDLSRRLVRSDRSHLRGQLNQAALADQQDLQFPEDPPDLQDPSSPPDLSNQRGLEYPGDRWDPPGQSTLPVQSIPRDRRYPEDQPLLSGLRGQWLLPDLPNRFHLSDPEDLPLL